MLGHTPAENMNTRNPSTKWLLSVMISWKAHLLSPKRMNTDKKCLYTKWTERLGQKPRLCHPISSWSSSPDENNSRSSLFKVFPRSSDRPDQSLEGSTILGLAVQFLSWSIGRPMRSGTIINDLKEPWNATGVELHPRYFINRS